MSTPFAPRSLGKTQLPVGPLGLGSSYGLPAKDVERAFERGVRFFLWGSRRRAAFGEGLRNLGRAHREDMVVAIQTYTRMAMLMEWSVDRALKELRTDYVDVLGLAWWNGVPPERLVERAVRLREKGKIRHIMISGHDRPTFQRFLEDARIDVMMLRYNAAHPGAEREIFPHLPAESAARPGVVAFTATRWGTLINPAFVPEGEKVPRAGDCYRFAMSNPSVDVCLSGAKDGAELDEALAAVDAGALDPDEERWMRRVGAAVRSATVKNRQVSLLDAVDRLASISLCSNAPRLPPGRA
jgi:aryl-alcohol dehydrogenase-like predicted oxidoreductase